MRTKQIAAKDMKEAMKLAKIELGEDAVLLHSEVATSGIIVTFALEHADADDAIAALLREPAPAHPFWPQVPLPEEEIEAPAAHLAPPSPRFEIDHPALNVLDDLVRFHRVPSPLKEKFLGTMRHAPIPSGHTLDAAEEILTHVLTSHVPFKPVVFSLAEPRALMLVGAHGAGKTTLLAKFATECALKKLPVCMITTDTERLGGTAALQSVADILGCDLLVAETRTQLRNLVKSQQGKAITLIDSAGVNIYRFQELKMLGEFASLADVEPVLVCPAGIDADEAQETTSVFSFLDIRRMVLTRTDTTRHFASLFSAINYSPLALSHLSLSARPAEPAIACDGALLARHLLNHYRDKMAH